MDRVVAYIITDANFPHPLEIFKSSNGWWMVDGDARKAAANLTKEDFNELLKNTEEFFEEIGRISR